MATLIDEFSLDCRVYNDLSMPDNCDLAADMAEHFGIDCSGYDETVSSDSIDLENVDSSILRKIKSVDLYFEDEKITETYVYGIAHIVFYLTEHFSENEVNILKKLFRKGVGTEYILKENIRKVYHRIIELD